ncbi:MAG: type IV toxin-antitoxin system AbiEi family antitoxin domain-containing protein [Deinococcota bacterium]
MTTDLEQLFERHRGYLTRKQVEAAGLKPHLLTQAVRAGQIERIQPGVYRQLEAPLQNHEDVLEVQLRIPYAVLCLGSALAFHGLTTYLPKWVEIAVPQKSRPPALNYPAIQVHYFSDRTYRYGLEQHDHFGHTLKVYSPEKTLVDLFRFRGQLGQELFAEGLKNYLNRRQPRPSIPKLLEAARVARVEGRLRSLLEVVAAEPTL